MTQTASSQSGNRDRVSFPVIKAAKDGDVKSMTLIQRHFDPYIRRLATVSVSGTSYLDTELYERLKTKLIIVTLKFKC